jgi:MFS family permease
MGLDGSGIPPKRLLPLILVTTGMGVLTFALLNPALPDLADALGVSRGAIGLIQGAVAIPGIFLAILIGYFSDRIGRRQMMQFSLLVFGLAGLAGFLVRDFWGLVTLRAVQGIGTSGLLALGVVIIGDLFRGPDRRWALGVNSAGITITALIAPTVGGLLATGGAFRPFLLYALALPLVIPAALLPGRPPGEPPAPPLQHLRGMVADLRRSGRFVDFMGLLPFSMLAMLVIVGFAFTTTPLFLEDEFGLDALQRGVLQSVLSVGATVTAVGAGWMARRWTGGRILDLSLLSIALGFVVVGLSPNLWGVALGLIVLGLGVGAIFPVFQDSASSAGPTVYRGALVGTWISSIRLGQSIGPVVAAVMAVTIGARPSYLIAAGAVGLLIMAWRPLRHLAAGRVADGEADYRPTGLGTAPYYGRRSPGADAADGDEPAR